MVPVEVMLLEPIANVPPIVRPVSVPSDVIFVCAALVTVPAVVADPAEVAEVAVAAFPPIERLATGVVEATTNGAVPVEAVEVICPETVRPVSVPSDVIFVCAAPVTVAAVPETLPVTLPVRAPENPVAVKIPVDGTKERAVEVVFCGRLPVLAVTQVGYTAEEVTASLVIPVLVALVALVAEAALPSILVIPVRASAPDDRFKVTAVVPIYMVEELAALSPVLVPLVVPETLEAEIAPAIVRAPPEVRLLEEEKN